MPHPELQAYKDGFFSKFLADLPGTPTLETLQGQQPAGQPLVLLGDYINYEGAAVTPVPNASITPQFAVRADASGTPQTFLMLWIVERFDVATDSAATIARILADFRPATATTTEGLTSDLARTWSQALTADATKQALAMNLSAITAVPAGLPTSDLAELKTFLGHFGTYKADGTYYTKGTVAEGAFPTGASPEYMAANIAEVKLYRDQFYCSALAAEKLWNPQAAATRFRQLVYRIEDQGADASDRYRLALIHTTAAELPAGSGSRFIVFHAPVGLGVALPTSSMDVMAPSAAAILEDLPSDSAALQELLNNPNVPIVGTADNPFVLLMGAIRQNFPSTPLPDGVIVSGEGVIRTFRCPPAQLRALVERTDIQQFEAPAPVWPAMTNAFAKMNYGARVYPTGITAATTGRGVLVGIIDGGIDGGHPAFFGRHDDATKSRIHSVWQMGSSGGQSPAQRSTDKAYAGMTYGRELIGHDEVITATDGGGHGTHVAGIAAGRAVAPWPGGVAPGATLVVVSTGRNGYVTDLLTGISYIFQKAKELSMPCVINISLCTERHSHDGTDSLSVGMMQLLSDEHRPGDGGGFGVLASGMPNFKEGRVVVAAAGNFRAHRGHWQATIPAGGDVQVLYTPRCNNNITPNVDGITFWAYNEDTTTVRLRVSTRHSSNAVLATPEVALMASNRRITSNLPGSVRVDIHNGPQSSNNRHFNPEIYWVENPATPIPAGPWIVRLRNTASSPCVVHGFCAFREHAGAFDFDTALTTPLIAVTYTADQVRSFNSHKVSIPATGPACISVAAFTSTPGLAPGHVLPGFQENDIAWFSSPGPLRAAGPGRRAIDVALPGNRIESAKSWKTGDTTRGTVLMQGTSMASPVMTGLVAAMLQINPRLTTGNIRARLELAASRRPGDTIDDWGLGRVDASLLLAEANVR